MFVESEVFGWEDFSSVLKALLATLQGFSAYMQVKLTSCRGMGIGCAVEAVRGCGK